MNEAVCSVLVFLLIVLFIGDPDLHDVLMARLRK